MMPISPISMQWETVSIDFSYFWNTSVRPLFFSSWLPWHFKSGIKPIWTPNSCKYKKCQTWKLLNFHQESDWQGSPLTFSIFQSWKFQRISASRWETQCRSVGSQAPELPQELDNIQIFVTLARAKMHGNDIIFTKLYQLTGNCDKSKYIMVSLSYPKLYCLQKMIFTKWCMHHSSLYEATSCFDWRELPRAAWSSCVSMIETWEAPVEI